MVWRALVTLVAAVCIGLSACAPANPASGGVIVLTAGGAALVDGSDDVPPDLQLRLSASPPVSRSDVSLTLDDRKLEITGAGDGLAARTAPLPLGSRHRLHGEAGRTIDLKFRVVTATPAMAAVHRDDAGRTVLDLSFGAPPSRDGVQSGIPSGGHPEWVDDRHLRATWGSGTGGVVDIPDRLPTPHGSHLAGRLRLELSRPSPGELRSAVVPGPAAGPAAPIVVAFTVATAASRASLAAHSSQVSIVSPTGWFAREGGDLTGQPDPATVEAAPGGNRSRVWPLVQNAGFDTAATGRLLHDDGAEKRLSRALVSACREAGYGGVTLDFESVSGEDRDALSGLVERLHADLRRDGKRLGVAVVPHKPGRVNAYSAAYDVPRLARASDLLTLMAYDQHTEGTGPGPIAGLDWDRLILQGSLAGTTPDRTLLGMPLYARTWDAGGRATADSYPESVREALSRPGARVDMDFSAMTKVIRTADGVTWFDDADSLARKLALVPANRLGGVAVWRLGFEDPKVWTLLPPHAAPTK